MTPNDVILRVILSPNSELVDAFFFEKFVYSTPPKCNVVPNTPPEWNLSPTHHESLLWYATRRTK
jgi:hypothetical protein